MSALVYSPNEVAALLGRSSRTVYRMIWTKELPARKIRGTWAVLKSDVDALLSENGAGRGVDIPTDPNTPSKSAA